MKLENIGEQIAERELFLHNDPSAKVLVRMGKPQPFPDSSGYYCPFQISGFGTERIFYGAGVDAFQAIELCFRIIGMKLAFISRDQGQQIRWECDEQGGWGFPFPEEFRDS